MAWIKIKNNLINLDKCDKIAQEENKIIFAGLVVIEFESEEKAKKAYEYLIIKLRTNSWFIDVDDVIK
jgi:uncharacterized protein (DUF1330 family)